MDNRPWSVKHQPTSPTQVVGQDDALAKVRGALQKYAPGGRAILLDGPVGCGKSILVYALAEVLNYEVLEVNASDLRNADELAKVVGNASKTGSLFGSKKLMLLDEIDGLAGNADRGGASAVAKIVESSRFPLVLTANDASDQKLSGIRKVSLKVVCKPLSQGDVVQILESIANKESLSVNLELLKSIARRSGGDARAAINDLQVYAAGGGVVEDFTGREKSEAVSSALLRVLKTTEGEIARSAWDRVDEDLDKIFLWVDENLPREYGKSNDLRRAYEALAKADIFFGRIRRWQYYRYCVYCYALLSVGVALAKDARYDSMTELTDPKRILKIWIASQKNAQGKALSTALAPMVHRGIRRSKEYIPLLRHLMKHSSMAQRAACEEALGCAPESLAWLAQ